jgi:hypothetical protein
VGNPSLAAAWLAGDSGIEVDVPLAPAEQLRWRLGLEHFFICNRVASQEDDKKPLDGAKKAAIDAADEVITLSDGKIVDMQ